MAAERRDAGEQPQGPVDQPERVGTHQRRVLEQIGRHWADTLGSRRAAVRTVPLDPGLGSYPEPPPPTRFGRVAPVQMFRAEAPDELMATEPAGAPETRTGLLVARLRRLVLGPPLRNSALLRERMRKLVAMPVLASDLLSSVAYGPESMLSVLILAGSAALRLSIPIAAGLIVLMITAGVSYRQTIPAYPQGAGAYNVAGDNLGGLAALVAAAGLMIDYVLTVAVSIASGLDAVTSVFPAVGGYTVPAGLAVILLLLAGNLRGVRQAGAAFAIPTYAFLIAIVLLLGGGLVQLAGRGFTVFTPPPAAAQESLGVLLALRAFTSGATSMTGIEAVSNAIPAFERVEWRNARTTLSWMVGVLVTMFAGLMALIHFDGIAPEQRQTVLSQLGHIVFGGGPLYDLLQAATALILLFAANTSYNDFPRLLFFMARSYDAPRVFLRLGDRLAFSNGIIALSVAAALIFGTFHGNTGNLIPLYAVGVFLAFTLSQSGMVVHWWRRRGSHWRKSMVVNGLGALLSALVLVTAAATKFTEGAWLVVIVIPCLVLLFRRIRHHYDVVRDNVALHPIPAQAARNAIIPARRFVLEQPPTAAGEEQEESPEELQHLAVVPMARLDLASLRALAYAASLSIPVMGAHISPSHEEAEEFREQWNTWGDHLHLEIIESPYRAIVAPLAHYLKALRAERPDVTLTVVVPEIIVKRHWQELLHSHTGDRLRRAVRHQPGIVVTTVPVHLPA
jgi:amino acid transporter